MLTRVQIKDFRCLRDVDVPLKPLTVLIGPNNTGKSAFLSALQMLGTVPTHGETEFKIKKSDLWGFDTAVAPRIVGTLRSNSAVVVQRGNMKEPLDTGPFWIRKGDNDSLTPINYFCGSAMVPAMTSKGAQGIPEINDKASNVPAVLDALLRKDRHRFDKIVDILRSCIPGLKNLGIETPSAEGRRIDLVLEDGMMMEAELASHGVKLMIFFVVLANHPKPPKTILIEEPETGVHPKRLDNIVKLLRGLLEGTYADYQSQVIISTHSPYLLDYIDPEKDQVLVFEQHPDGSRNARPVDTERLKMFRDEFMLGEIWYSQEEAGLVEKSS
ncbi:MAG: AAA family ATPase [Bythopirellula sp.]|nr:AAA family ATPase [Bythopirellula sp.]